MNMELHYNIDYGSIVGFVNKKINNEKINNKSNLRIVGEKP